MFWTVVGFIIVFLIGFFCGRAWVELIEGRVVPLKTVILIVFGLLIMVIIVVTLIFTKNQGGVPISMMESLVTICRT